MTDFEDIYDLGQSLWLNYLRRAFIESGELSDVLGVGITGLTSTPTIFEKAITGSADYDERLQRLLAQGKPAREIYEALVVDDIQRAADVLHPIFEESEGRDGYVTLELNPALAHDAVGTVAEARHVLHGVNRPNVMIEIPATDAGIEAIETLTRDGVNVNATHIFTLETYEEVAKAYLQGLQHYIKSHSVWRQTPASVASFSVSRIDQAVDRLLDGLGRTDLQGKTGIALAKVIYQRFREIFSGPEWENLTRRGGRVQRPKWTRTTQRNFLYPDTLYVDALMGPDTVNTLSMASYNAARDRATVANTVSEDLDAARTHLDELEKLGIDLEVIGQELQAESLTAFDNYFQALIESVLKKRDELEHGWRRMDAALGQYQEEVDRALFDLGDDKTMRRIWAHDWTVWKSEPDEISNRLGWLHIIETMQENTGRLQAFFQAVRDDGYNKAVVLGMGGSSLAPELFAKTFTPWTRPAYSAETPLELSVLDTTDPDAIRAETGQLDLAKTLFIVSSKSGGTVETLSGFNYFYNLVQDALGAEEAGAHFVAVTDPGTGLAKLAERYGFRDVFANDPNIGGRYSALSYFGLLPAVLTGVDLDILLDRGLAMATNAASCNQPLRGDNHAARLGAIMGLLARKGRDKLTLITSPAVSSFGDWVEQLVAESTGKEGQGIVPVVGESPGAPDVYGDDRLFVYVRLEGDDSCDQTLNGLKSAGQPVVTINLKDVYDLGGQFFTWEMATAVAGHFLGINPFDQPNVEAAKILAKDMVAEYQAKGELPAGDFAPLSADSLSRFLSSVKPGDYIALQAYIQPTLETQGALTALRAKLRDQYKVATTLGYGPRFLHSTGQLHKGDRGNGLFIQFTTDPQADIPIPDQAGQPESSMTFGVLKLAQAMGDAQALGNANRRLIRFHLGTNVVGDLERLLEN